MLLRPRLYTKISKTDVGESGRKR